MSILYRIFLRLTDERQERCSSSLGGLAFLGLGIYSLVKGSETFRDCNSIPNLNYFAVTFSSLSIILAVVRIGMAIEKTMKNADDFSLTGKVCFASLGLILVGLAGWGSSLTFGTPTPEEPCGDLFSVAKTQCIITWIMFGLALLRLLRKFVDKAEEENQGGVTEDSGNDAEKNLLSEEV